jgi:two-component system, chemotaxis family, protein-glutamate methylesterase/glutaminase
MAVGHDIIVMGASAGGMQVVIEILRGLPRDLPAAVFVVLHTAPSSPGILPQILDRASALSCAHAKDGERIQRGRVYVAQPDHHILLKDGRIVLTRGPRENGFRPAVDPLFRTAARVYGPRVIGVVLSGGLDDGTEGLLLVKRHGGIAVVQDPEEAIFPSMPASAIQTVEVDHVLPTAAIAPMLVRLAHQPVAEGALPMAEGNGAARDVAEGGDNALQTGMPGPPSKFTCPDCGGALWELRDGRLIKYRCHVGHGYTPDGLVAAQSEALETALWSALRALEENADLRRRMARRAAKGNWPQLVRQYELQAAETEERATVIRNLLLSDKPADGHQAEPTLDEQRKKAGKKADARKANGRQANGRHGNGRQGKAESGERQAARVRRSEKGNGGGGKAQAAHARGGASGKGSGSTRRKTSGTRDSSTVPVRGGGT